jgi:hypothetical protein
MVPVGVGAPLGREVVLLLAMLARGDCEMLAEGGGVLWVGVWLLLLFVLLLPKKLRIDDIETSFKPPRRMVKRRRRTRGAVVGRFGVELGLSA